MPSAKLRFRDYLLDPDGFELCRAGHRLRLERKPMELLILLAENQGHLVKREEIIEKIWGKDFFFDAENGVNNAIRKIRSALNDSAERILRMALLIPFSVSKKRSLPQIFSMIFSRLTS